MPVYCVEVVHSFSLGYWVSGLAKLDNLIVLLAIPKELDKNDKHVKPELMMFDPKTGYSLIGTDSLSIRGHEEHTPKDYNLEYLVEEKQYFILSPKDIVLGKPRDEDDHIEWMLDHQEFEQALEQTQKQQKLLRKFTYLDVGKKYLDHLLETEQFSQASVLCTKILGRDKEKSTWIISWKLSNLVKQVFSVPKYWDEIRIFGRLRL